ncbi:MAG: hypothetical protein LBF58_09275 [Deltaproteobacteria bacterium]|jgi:hypothetical protein|nr:hypothetical protein [Deltaproteobacteria bacterium]
MAFTHQRDTMKPKSLILALVSCVFFFALASPLPAQDVTVTSKDVDIFIKMANLRTDDRQAMEKLFAQTGRDADAYEDVMAKILGIITMIDQNETNVNEMSDSLGVRISQAEYNLVNKRKREIMSAVVKMFNK